MIDGESGMGMGKATCPCSGGAGLMLKGGVDVYM